MLQPDDASTALARAGSASDLLTPARVEPEQPWADLAACQDPGELASRWLSLHCQTLPQVSRGLLLLGVQGAGSSQSVFWPEHGANAAHLIRAAERSLSEGEEVVFWARDDSVTTVGIVAAVPLRKESRIIGAVAFLLEGRTSLNMPRMKEQIGWSLGWLETLTLQRTIDATQMRLTRTAGALDLLAAAGEHRRLEGTLLNLVNELAARLHCQRVSIGLIRTGRSVRLLAVSHSASVRRRSQIARAIENAMDEALDQTSSIRYPAPEPTQALTLAHRALAKASGATATASIVLFRQGQPFGAITLERQDGAFEEADVELCEATATLVAPLIDVQHQNERWISGRIVDAISSTTQALVGRGHPALKLGFVAALAGLMGLGFADGEYRIAAKTVLEGSIQRAAVAPFEGFITQAPRRAGDTVQQGELLASLDDKDLVLDRAKSISEMAKLQQKYNEALAKHDRAAMGVLQAQRAQAQAQLTLTEEKLARSRITAPFDGIVVSGDLSQMLGSPVEKGKLLFEVAPLHGYRAVLQVDERDIRYVAAGQIGHLALAADPAHPLPFEIVRVTPVASADEGRNAFRVEASLLQNETTALRPGLEGVAKIEAGSRSLLWIWTHSLVDWLRLTAWKWLW